MSCDPLGLEDLLSSSASVGYWRFLGGDSLTDANYLQYLREAREVVGGCAWACQVWSAPYDGLRPSPEDYREEEEERQQREEAERRRAEREREEDGVLPFVSSSQALSPAAPASVPIYAPPAADGSSGGQSHGLLELEWDDMFESGMEGGDAEPVAGKDVEPPQHLVEMRRSAISLVQGSYVEEAEFQDDVLVYSLIAQRDSHSHARPRTLAHTHCSSTHTAVQSARIRPRKAASDSNTHTPMDTRTHTDTLSHTNTVTQNAHRDSHTVSTVQSAHTHSSAHTESTLTNGLGPDMDHSGSNAKIIISTQDCVQNGLDYNSHLPRNCNSQHPQGFVSQCLELIQSLGWEAESIMGDEEFSERVQRLSFALQEEVELRFDDPEPLKLPEADLTKKQKQGQDAPFTGLLLAT